MTVQDTGSALSPFGSSPSAPAANAMAAPTPRPARCRKHEAEPAFQSDDPEEQLAAFVSGWGSYVRCKHCGLFGLLSNGNRRFGRPRRIIWLRKAGATERHIAKLEGFRAALRTKAKRQP